MRTVSYALIVTLQAVLVFSGTAYLGDRLFSAPESSDVVVVDDEDGTSRSPTQGHGEVVKNQLGSFNAQLESLRKAHR